MDLQPLFSLIFKCPLPNFSLGRENLERLYLAQEI